MKYTFLICFTLNILVLYHWGFCSGQDNPEEGILTKWEFAAQREELEPIHFLDEELKFEDQPTLVLAGNGKN